MHRRPVSQILFPGEDIDPQTICSMCGDFTIASIIPIFSSFPVLEYGGVRLV